jgi:hypothetical protein
VQEDRTNRAALFVLTLIVLALNSIKPLLDKERIMSNLNLTFACGLYDRTVPVFAKEIQSAGVDLNFVVIDEPRAIFDRMGGGLEFDAFEFSSSEFIARYATGNTPFIALPFFPSRIFRHSTITVSKRSGIKTPKDLEGKRASARRFTFRLPRTSPAACSSTITASIFPKFIGCRARSTTPAPRRPDCAAALEACRHRNRRSQEVAERSHR